MSDHPPIIDSGRCETCRCFNLKSGFAGKADEPARGRCSVRSGREEYGYVDGTFSCEHYRFDHDAGEHLAQSILYWILCGKGKDPRGKSFEQMKAMLEPGT